MCLAAGNADGHKEVVAVDGTDMLAIPMLLAAAELADPIAQGQRIITLSSRLDEPHGYYFSGMSGGTLYTIEGDDMLPAEIVFEGYPSTKDGDSGFLGKNDIFIRALALSPEIFLEWLERAK